MTISLRSDLDAEETRFAAPTRVQKAAPRRYDAADKGRKRHTLGRDRRKGAPDRATSRLMHDRNGGGATLQVSVVFSVHLRSLGIIASAHVRHHHLRRNAQQNRRPTRFLPNGLTG
jgi:hypothetical protein